MKARDIMTTKVISVGTGDVVEDIVSLLLEKHLSAVPVVNTDGHVVGMVSEGDLMHRPELGTDKSPSRLLALFESFETKAKNYVKTHGMNAREVMSHPAVTASPDAELSDVVSIMDRKNVKRLPIVDGGALVGLVSRSDLLRALSVRQKQAIDAPSESDTEIRDHLMTEFRSEAWASVPLLNVDVVDGTVHIWGVIDNEEQREAMHIAAKRIPGVKDVVDHLSNGLLI